MTFGCFFVIVWCFGGGCLLWRVPFVTGAVGGGEKMSSLCCLACRDHIVLTSMVMMFSASIGVGVIVTGAVGVGFDFFRIGDGGEENVGAASGRVCEVGISILKDRVFAP